MPSISSPACEILGIKHPVILAGMNGVAGAKLAAAVTNAGGLGTIGGVGFTPKMLRAEIDELKSLLDDPKAPFGIDLLLPQIGGSARKTNKDYTKGALPELIDIICGSGAKVFISAVGVPPAWAVEKLHGAGILIQNMIGHPKHATKAMKLGVDIICAQGTEGGGHTGDVATSILIPRVVDVCRGHMSPLTGKPVLVIAAGGIFDGRGLAMAFALGASAVWVGTRFILADESSAGPKHRKDVLACELGDTIRSTIYTGRPMRVVKNPTNMAWEHERHEEMLALQAKGILPFEFYMKEKAEKGEDFSIVKELPMLTGQLAGIMDESYQKPAKVIIEEMVAEACAIMTTNATFAKL